VNKILLWPSDHFVLDFSLRKLSYLSISQTFSSKPRCFWSGFWLVWTAFWYLKCLKGVDDLVYYDVVLVCLKISSKDLTFYNSCQWISSYKQMMIRTFLEQHTSNSSSNCKGFICIWILIRVVCKTSLR